MRKSEQVATKVKQLLLAAFLALVGGTSTPSLSHNPISNPPISYVWTTWKPISNMQSHLVQEEYKIYLGEIGVRDVGSRTGVFRLNTAMV